MPKRMVRLGRHRVLARSLDDRIGCTALLLALRHLDSNTVQRRLTFAWVVEEEIGLVGSRALAATLPDVTRVYAVDTSVSSDALRVAAFGLCTSGAGGGAPGDGQWHGGAAPSHRCRARAGAIS